MRIFNLVVLFAMAAVLVHNGHTLSFGQDKHPYYVIQLPNFFDTDGIVFTKDETRGSFLYGKDRFTPTKVEVEKAEGILNHLVDMGFAGNRDGYRVASRLMHVYRRQYAGYVNDQGQKIVLIVMTTPGFDDDELRSGLVLIFDEGGGGSLQVL